MHISILAELNRSDRQINETPVETFATNVCRGNSKVMCCVLCKGDDYSDECERFKLLTDHKQRLITQGQCFLYCKAGHTFKDNPLAQRQNYHNCGKQGHQLTELFVPVPKITIFNTVQK